MRPRLGVLILTNGMGFRLSEVRTNPVKRIYGLFSLPGWAFAMVLLPRSTIKRSNHRNLIFSKITKNWDAHQTGSNHPMSMTNKTMNGVGIFFVDSNASVRVKTAMLICGCWIDASRFFQK